MRNPTIARSRLRPIDLVALSTSGLRARPLRAILSALGIAIGIAAMVAVLGISASSQAKLTQRLEALGTNLLTVEAGKTMFGSEAELPKDSEGRVARISGSLGATGVGTLSHTHVYRSDMIPETHTGGLSVQTVSESLAKVLNASLRTGTWFTDATAAFPTVILGDGAARRLGIEQAGSLVWLGNQQFTVIGILDPLALAPELDSAALVSNTIAREHLGYEGAPTRVYLRADEELLPSVRKLLPQTLSPEQPETVKVSRPSDALAAKGAADETFTLLLLGLGSLGLLIGGIGVANTMIISVIERRKEIGLRRALGARRSHIRRQFLGEALVLSALGGIGGTVIGAIITVAFARSGGMPFTLPIYVVAAAMGSTLIVGAIAGISPAWRAARVPPTVALSG